MKGFGSKSILSTSAATKVETSPENGQLWAEIAPIDGSHWQLRLHPLEYKRKLNPDLSGLLASSLASNPFFDPAILAASRLRITQSPIHQLVLWEKAGEQSLPRLQIPLIEDHGSLWQQTILRSFTHPYAPLGNPLIAADAEDRLMAGEITSRLVQLIGIAFENGLPPLVLDYLERVSPLGHALADLDKNSPISTSMAEMGERASIQMENGKTPELPINKKRMREYTRLEKKLSALGTVSHEKATDTFDVLLRLEEYLLMETRGWKGRRGTSIHAIKRDAAFARQSVMDLAREGRCEIFTLRVNDFAIASTILFIMNGHYYPWKICFNESFARYSPGTQLMLKLTADITSRKDFRHADSLAHFGRSWMSALWPTTTVFDSWVLAADQKSADAVMERISLSSRSKNLVKRLLGRK